MNIIKADKNAHHNCSECGEKLAIVLLGSVYGNPDNGVTVHFRLCPECLSEVIEDLIDVATI